MIFHKRGSTLVLFIDEAPTNGWDKMDLEVSDIQEKNHDFVVYKNKKVHAWSVCDQHIGIYPLPVRPEHQGLLVRRSELSIDRVLKHKYSLSEGIGAYPILKFGEDDCLEDWMLDFPLFIHREEHKIIITTSSEEDAMEIKLKL